MSSTPIETERKFLIKMPDMQQLAELEGVRIKDITQTYLVSDDGKNARVRKIVENGKTSYIKTVKQRISTLSCFEEEYEINENTYAAELKLRDTEKNTIQKVRYCLPYEGHILEIDIYPFWLDRAILEIELRDENEAFAIPSFLEIIKEVSDDKRYKNTNLALEVPFDEI